jgi:hypothetical protein
MTQPPPPVAASPYPGWAWEPQSGQWVPAPQQPPAPPYWDGRQQQQYSAQYQQAQAQYLTQATPTVRGATLGMHFKRAIDWNVSDVVLSPREKAQLDAAGVVEPRMQALLAWRRSTLLVSFPILVLGVVLSFIAAAKQNSDDSSLTGIGKLVEWLPSIALLLVPLGVLIVIGRWTELRSTSRALIICWALSIVVPLAAALLPIDVLIDVDSLKAQATSADQLQEIEAIIFTGRISLAINYALTLLPVIITIPAGVIKGAGRVKFLFPAAALPGWFLVAVAPFYSLFLIVVFVLIDQIVGNVLLILGVGLLAFSPWLFVIKRRVYGRSMSIAEARQELPKAGRLGGLLTLGAFALIIIYLLTAKVAPSNMRVIGTDDKKSVFTVLQVLRTAVEVFGRNLVTSVVFCMIFLSMVFAEWRATQAMRPEVRAEHDMEMNALRRYTEAARQPSSV